MIALEDEVFCPLCHQQYNHNNIPRLLTTCGHSFCETCISSILAKNSSKKDIDNGHPFIITCPDDGVQMKLKSKEIKNFPKNFALIKMIEAKKANCSFRDESFELSKIVKKQQMHEDDETNDLISTINDCKLSENESDFSRQIGNAKKVSSVTDIKQNKNKKKSQKCVQNQKQEDQMCLLHQKPLQIVCIIDNKKICSKCAIFGEHRGHDFKSIEEVQNEKNSCYTKILEIFKEKQQIQQRMCNQETQSGLIEILDKKRDLLQKQVREEFRKLRQQITKQERCVLKKLQEAYKRTENKIKSLLKVDEKILTNFSTWQVQSYGLLKILQNSEIEQKVNLLYSKQKRTQIVLHKGNEILNKIKQQQTNLINQAEQILVDLQCKKSKNIFSQIPVFIQISDKPTLTNADNNKKKENLDLSTLLVENSQKMKVDNGNNGMNLVQGSPLLEQSLLEGKEQEIKSFILLDNIESFNHNHELRLPLQPNNRLTNTNIIGDSVNSSFMDFEIDSGRKIVPKTAIKNIHDDQNSYFQSSRCNSILTSRPSLVSKKQNGQKPNKKKLKSIKISEKYQKILEGIYNNTVDTVDLTNAEVGDQTMAQICQFVKFSKARTIKFIRNKLSDTGVEKILPALSNAQILNLSQNNLTEAVIDIFIKHRYGCLSGLKNLILSQNKIIERKHKAKIDQLRAMNLVVSV